MTSVKVDSAPHSVAGTPTVATTSMVGLEFPLPAVAVTHNQFPQMEMPELMVLLASLPMNLLKLLPIPLALVGFINQVPLTLRMETSVLGTSLMLLNCQMELYITWLLEERVTMFRPTGT